MKIYKGKDTGEENYFYNFREIEDPNKINVYANNIFIDLDPCPFCGFRATLNRNRFGWYGDCPNCGAKGPECRGDWVKAAKIWNGRSLREYCEASGRDKHKLVSDTFDLEYRLDEAGKEYMEEE